MLAERTAFSATDVAADVHLCAWLGEGEITWAQTYLGVGTEHLLGEEQKHLLEVLERDVLVDVEAFHLVEEAVGAGRDGLVPIYSTGADDADGGLCLLHHTCLHAAGMRAEDDVGVRFHEERILHVTRRMVVGKVHAAIYVPVVFHLRSLGQREAQAAEDIHYLVLHDGERVACAQCDGVGGACQVHVRTCCLLGGGTALQCVYLVEGGILKLIELHAKLLLHVGRHIAEVCHQC